MKVLIVEDQEELGQVFVDFLLALGHLPVLVRTAEGALGRLRTERPDAIVLDIDLPGMSGVEFLRLRPIREAALPIVAVSGVATEAQARDCLRLGALDFIAKPVALERLREVFTFIEPHTTERRQADEGRWLNRRRSLRVPASLGARVIEYGGVEGAATTVNIDVHGVKLRCEHPVAPGSAVKVRLAPSNGNPPLELVALLARRDPDGDAFTFVGVSDTDFDRLTKLVHWLSSR